MKRLLIFTLSLAALMTSCTGGRGDRIADPEDYKAYLDTPGPEPSSKYFRLWNSKIKPDSMQLQSFGIVASEYERFFRLTGEVAYLQKAEKALEKAVSIAAIGKAGYHRALARNYIAQHRFRDGLDQADLAMAQGSGKEATRTLYFDLHMELGNYKLAESYLDSIQNYASFGYLIRLAKWNDYKGDLTTTIRLMEEATEIAESSNDPALRAWSYANLGDFYGHAGRIRDSYEMYLRTLDIDPHNAHAKKGISWIVYSYDRNPREARRILEQTRQVHASPDHELLLAEIAAHMGQEKQKREHLDNYFKKVKQGNYGRMYAPVHAELYLDEINGYRKGLELAHEEVYERATPETYALLAYAYQKSGNMKKALAIIDREVMGKTHEPAVLLQAAEIYKAAGKAVEKDALKEELLEATYELGPVTSLRVAAL